MVLNIIHKTLAVILHSFYFIQGKNNKHYLRCKFKSLRSMRFNEDTPVTQLIPGQLDVIVAAILLLLTRYDDH